MTHDPMALAVKALSALCDDVDAAETIDGALQTAFSDAKIQLKDEIKYRVLFDVWAKQQLEAAKEAYRYFRSRADRIEEVHKAFKDRTRDAMLLAPDFEYRCDLGKISLVENQPSVDYAFGDKHVNDEVIDFYAIPAEYLKEKVSYEVDHARVKAELLEGKELPWARLKDKTYHVRFPAQKKPKQLTPGEQDND